MKKILFISDYSFKVPGGAQKSMEIIMDGLSDQYEFYVAMPGEKYQNKKKYNIIFMDRFDNLLVNENIIKSINIIKELNKIIETVQPDIIHTHMVSGMSAIEVLKMLGKIKCPLVYTERGVANKYSKINKFILKKIAKNFNKIVTTTEFSKKIYLDKYNIKEDKIVVIPNTGGELFDNFDEEKVKKIREKYNLNKDTIMFNARYTYDKNWDLAKQIMEYIKDKNYYQFIVVIGSDRSEEDISRCELLVKEIQDIVGNENLRSFIDLELKEVSDLYYASDIFILTSRSESFGRTAVEAMSRKNIVFGTDIDGLSEVIGYEEYKYTNLEDFRRKFDNIKNYNIELEKEHFYKRYNSKFCTNINISMYKDVYSELLN